MIRVEWFIDKTLARNFEKEGPALEFYLTLLNDPAVIEIQMQVIDDFKERY